GNINCYLARTSSSCPSTSVYLSPGADDCYARISRMTAIDVAIICLMAIGLVACVGEPLVRRGPYQPHRPEANDDAGSLLLQKEMLYVAIRDLDFDFQTGKVDQKDYGELRRQLEGEAVDILRQLDAVDPLVVFDNEVERQVMGLRQRPTSIAC